MVLVNPQIIGPISTLTGPYGIRLQGQIPGYGIEIWTATPIRSIIGTGQANSSDERFSLLPGVTLESNMKLYAMQHGDNDISKPILGDNLVGVQPAPTNTSHLGAIDFEATVYECGMYLWVTGGFPGAKVEVTAGTSVLGSGPILEGEARIELYRGIPAGTVRIRQLLPVVGLGPTISRAVTGIPIPKNLPLPHPVVRTPLRGCDSAIEISGVYEGALVTVETFGAEIYSAGFGRSSLWFILPKPLHQDDKIVVSQSVWAKCEWRTKPTDPIPVSPATPVDPPEMVPPVCSGTTAVKLKNLRGNSRVQIMNEGLIFNGQTPPDATECVFLLSDLLPGSIYATQELYGVVSDKSVPIKVEAHMGSVPPCTVMGTLFECARNVTVSGVHPGSILQVFAVNEKGEQIAISGQVFPESDMIVVDVSPWLQSEWKGVQAAQWACSNTAIWSKIEPVVRRKSDDYEQMRLPWTLYEGETVVKIDRAVAGAHVDVFVTTNNGFTTTLAGSTNASYKLPMLVNVPALKVGDSVMARQTLCPLNSAFTKATQSDPSTVQPLYQPRPFFNISHNPNTIQEVAIALNSGANALGPDINVYYDSAGTGHLCMSHDEDPNHPLPLKDYLVQLREIARQYPQSLALVAFDCKPPTHTPEYGLEILTSIREFLTDGLDPPLAITISVPYISNIALFKEIAPLINDYEGLMIDQQDYPGSVANALAKLKIRNPCFGNGNSFTQNPVTSPDLRPSIEHGCGLRTGYGTLKFVIEWTTDDESRMVEQIMTGVDGIITGEPLLLLQVMRQPRFAGYVRSATRGDNPYRQPEAGYAIQVQTGTRFLSGTDSVVTFTITGEGGSVSRVIDTDLRGRMEVGDLNWVTMHSPDLGRIQTLTIKMDNSGGRWFVEGVRVDGWRFGVHMKGVVRDWIHEEETRVVELVDA